MSVIAAISTPIGQGAIAIVRMSGTGCLALAMRFFSSKSCPDAPIPNHLYLGHFAGEGFSEQCFLVTFVAPHSYTGEEMVELQIHGGVVIAREVLSTLLAHGARAAQNGEFTRRAFLNGKLTLAQAEGILGVITAQSRAAIGLASGMMQGSMQARLAPMLQSLQGLLATLEAAFDYPDEMEGQVTLRFGPTVDALIADLQALADTAHDGKMARDGIAVAIVGQPNVGKSSLLNRMLRQERAIVTPIAGTTRDTICESVMVEGVRLNLLDTAGLRDTADTVERLGVQRAMTAAKEADAVIYVLDATLPDGVDESLLATLTGRVFVVYNKADLAPAPAGARAICARTGEGVDQLLRDVAAMAMDVATDGGVLCEERHVAAVGTALTHLRRARQDYTRVPLDCTVLSLRAAYLALGEVDGATATDAVLDSVFSRFCVGK